MADKSIIDEFKEKIDKPLRAAFSRVSDENRIRDMLISQQQEKIAKLESQMELMLSILRSQDEKLRKISVEDDDDILTFPQNNMDFPSKSLEMDQKVQKISQKLDLFSKFALSPAQEWIIEQVKDLQQKNHGNPVLSKAIQEMFYADRPEIRAKRHAFYHHVSKCVDSGRLGKVIAGNQMFLYIPKIIFQKIRN